MNEPKDARSSLSPEDYKVFKDLVDIMSQTNKKLFEFVPKFSGTEQALFKSSVENLEDELVVLESFAGEHCA